MNAHVLTVPFGRLLRASPALPGSGHDLTAARTCGITDALAAAEPKCCEDRAYQGVGHPYGSFVAAPTASPRSSRPPSSSITHGVRLAKAQ